MTKNTEMAGMHTEMVRSIRTTEERDLMRARTKSTSDGIPAIRTTGVKRGTARHPGSHLIIVINGCDTLVVG